MRHIVGITRLADSFEATVFDLPGCRTSAASEEVLRAQLPLAIAEFESWLARHGEEVAATPDVDVVERIVAAGSNAADGEFTFAWDREPTAIVEVHTALRWMVHARHDLVALTDPLPELILDWRPPDSAMAQLDPWKPHALTIREIVADIANAEAYYRSGVSDDPESSVVSDPMNLARERERTGELLRALNDEQCRRLYHVRRDWQPDGTAEEWTVRKVLRRIIGHERFHTKEIEQRLAWLLVGIPDLGRP